MHSGVNSKSATLKAIGMHSTTGFNRFLFSHYCCIAVFAQLQTTVMFSEKVLGGFIGEQSGRKITAAENKKQAC